MTAPRLHVWAGAAWAGALLIVILTARNPLLTVLIVVGSAVLAGSYGGRRQGAYWWWARLGVAMLVLRLVLGMIAGPVDAGTHLLWSLPVVTVGSGVSLGGAYTTLRMAASLELGLTALACCLIVGMSFTICSAEQWCELAGVFFGRGARFLMPVLYLGEAAVQNTAQRRGRGRDSLLETDARLVAAHEALEVPRPPRPAASAVAAGLWLASLVAVMLIQLVDGVQIEHGPRLDGGLLAGGLLAAWMLLRVVVGRERTGERFRSSDRLVLVAALILVLARLGATLLGEDPVLNPPPGQWPAFPVVTASGLVLAVSAAVFAHRLNRGPGRAHA